MLRLCKKCLKVWGKLLKIIKGKGGDEKGSNELLMR
jgi:hypothetical protein